MKPLEMDVEQLISQLVAQIQQHPIAKSAPKIVGIKTGGVWIAKRLHQALNLEEPVGTINTAFYRDDFETRGFGSNVTPSDIPWDVDGAHIILVDDVLFTGRTIRGAINEIFDFGRPASVTLVALVDRKGYRQLPFQADIVGVEINSDYPIKLQGPKNLTLCQQIPDEEITA